MDASTAPAEGRRTWQHLGRLLLVAVPGLLLWGWDIAADVFFYARTRDPLLGTEDTGIGAWGGLWWLLIALLAVAFWYAASAARKTATPLWFRPAVAAAALFSLWSILVAVGEYVTP